MKTDNKVIKRWYDMISINSVNGNEKEIADYIANELEKMGLKAKYSYFEEDVENKQRPSITTEIDSGKAGDTFLLIGHIDTVSVAEGWDTDPFTPTEDLGDKDKVYGLGAMDMKGGLAAILETLEYFNQNKDQFNGKIIAAFVSDEEVLSKGTYQLVDEGLMADYALMAECRYDNVAVGFRGRYSFEVEVKGIAAHASHYGKVGENALINASKMAIEIENLPTLKHDKLGQGTWCVRYIEGGSQNMLIVPEKCYLLVDRFVVPGEDDKTCIKQIEDAAKSLGLENKVNVRLKPRSSDYMKSFSLDESHELVTTLQEKYKEVTKKELPVAYDQSVCDSNIIADLGIPIVTFGPSGGGMHAANEYGFKWQVINCGEIYIKLIKEILNKK